MPTDPFAGPWAYDKRGSFIHLKEVTHAMVLDMRGWGYLTGSGGLRMRMEDAEKIQDEWGRRIVEWHNARPVKDKIAELAGRLNALSNGDATNHREGMRTIARQLENLLPQMFEYTK